MAQPFTPKESGDIRYQVLENRTDGAEKAALVVYLHGRSGSGEDNETQMQQAGVEAIGKYIVKNGISAYFLVPQCPSDHEWDARDNRPGYTEKVEALITQYLGEKDIDTDRIYICGASMGACGVWRMLKDNPGLFAAAILASGQAQRSYPEDFTGTPLYVTVGSNERSYEALRWFTSQISKAGGSVQFDVLAGQNHRAACDNAFSSKRLKWLFSQNQDIESFIKESYRDE